MWSITSDDVIKLQLQDVTFYHHNTWNSMSVGASAPDPNERVYSALPNPLAGFLGKEMEGKCKTGKGEST